MPKIQVNGTTLHYEDHGSGAETIVFAHGLLWSGDMFAAQVAALKDHFRCVTFDFRGQGQSEIALSGYDMDTLTDDAAALIKVLDCGSCHFIGLSMGGFVGLRLAIRQPELISSLMLLETSSDPEPEGNIGRYKLLNFIARWFGLGLVATQVMPIMFGKKFLNDPSRTEEKNAWQARLVDNHRIGITRAVKGVIDRSGVTAQLSHITAPTLVIVGDQDIATVPEKSEQLHRGIKNSSLVIIPGAGHSSTIEEPKAVNSALKDFLLRDTQLVIDSCQEKIQHSY